MGSCDAKDTAEIIVMVEEASEAQFSYPSIISVGKSAEFDGSASKGNEANIVSWKWDFGDGGSGKGVKAKHTFRKPGRYFVALTIKTDSGTDCNSVTTQNIVVVNGPPVADAGKDKFVGVSEVVVFDGSGSYDTDGSIVRYLWDFGDGQTATGMEARHQYTAGGRYRVTLRVIDDTGADNNRATDEIQVVVNTPPQSVIGIRNLKSEIQNSMFQTCVGDKIQFTGENSADPDGNLRKSKKSRYYWDMGDGKTAEGRRVSHTYMTAGRYVCTLTVDDGSGVTNSRGQANMLVIVNQSPVARGGPDQVVCPGETVVFDGRWSVVGGQLSVVSGQSQRTTDHGPRTTDHRLKYHWDFGDGDMAEGERVTHVFDKPGRYEARLTVTDNSETACNTDEDVVFVKVNASPVAEAGPDKEAFTGGAHDAVFFDATRSSDPDGDLLTYYWDFGDDSHETTPQAFHTYVRPGKYTVRLRVTDGEGTGCGEIWDELTVTVKKRENVQ